VVSNASTALKDLDSDMKKILFAMAMLAYSLLPAHADSPVGEWCSIDCSDDNSITIWQAKSSLAFQRNNMICDLIRSKLTHYVGSNCFIGNDTKTFNIPKVSVDMLPSGLHGTLTYKGKQLLDDVFHRNPDDNDDCSEENK
jgi:hypothetical protein